MNYYREFIQELSEKTYPLKEHTKPSKSFEWKEEHANCFREVKDALVSAELLHQPSEDEKYILDTDVSEVAIAGILSQEQKVGDEVKESPIAFGSQALSETGMRYSAPKAEMLAAVYFMQKY